MYHFNQYVCRTSSESINRFTLLVRLLTRNLACRCLPPTLTITSEDMEVASLGVPGVPGPPEDEPPPPPATEAEIMAGSEAEEESPVQTICVTSCDQVMMLGVTSVTSTRHYGISVMFGEIHFLPSHHFPRCRHSLPLRTFLHSATRKTSRKNSCGGRRRRDEGTCQPGRRPSLTMRVVHSVNTFCFCQLFSKLQRHHW